MPSYYNEHDPKKAAWIRELMKEGLVTDGVVDTRSIELVQPADLAGFERCHFFAGIAVWDYALNLAGWTGPVWTGSCPCPSFSAAGKGQGFEDPRHLWPHWYRLIRECKPAVCFGEQVGAAIGHGWLDLVQDDLENEAYAVGAVVFPACSVGAPHIRQRLYWVAESASAGLLPGSLAGVYRREEGGRSWHGESERLGNAGALGESELSKRRSRSIGRGDDGRQESGRDQGASGAGESGTAGDMGDSEGSERGTFVRESRPLRGPQEPTGGSSFFDELGDAGRAGLEGRTRLAGNDGPELAPAERAGGMPGPVNGFWRDSAWIGCKDGKYRPIESGSFQISDELAADLGFVRDPSGGFVTFPLLKKGKARVNRLQGYGDAIVAQQAAAFILAYRQARGESVIALEAQSREVA